ncbi:alpha-keto acid decarboxylase family protein [Corynebacterium sp. 13CS0277]|uniref:alpha-keto acid decarboxylase family protein n=1 Tax=Corynebacterium sp. 13CS0277 TaxID=2071994 RepID=UPI002101579C|nr:thiamine pyrophosphate-binding protein [Corynebacterium sp. 13CS0277]
MTQDPTAELAATPAAHAHDDQSTYTVADYLFDRIAETGITEIFGVPGDFNLPFLDNVLAHPRLTWVGNNNELNAGYCADGYARLKGFAAMITTFGVGELSAINATAGSFAEYVPVLHIVGAPARATQASGLKVHHTLGDGKFTHFYDMARPVTCAQAWLTPANAAQEIDRVITTILEQRRPGYLLLSPDVARAPMYRPDAPLREEVRSGTSSAALAAFEQAAREFLDGQEITILADLLVHRLGAQAGLQELLDATDLPYATLAWGKTLVDESTARFAGVYAGAASEERARAAVEDCERLITLGVEFTDNTTAGFSMQLDEDRILAVDAHQATVGGRPFAPIDLRDAIGALQRVAQVASLRPHPLAAPTQLSNHIIDEDAQLTQDDLWEILAGWLPSDSIVVADQGTSFFGMADRTMPAGSMFIGQPLWGSIGYTLPAALGAGIADRSRRSILLIGDGSAQLTVQEISTMLREGINPLLVVINNSGYTVERAIHGPNQDYNDIATYSWQDIPAAFGGTDDNCLVTRAHTPRELRQALAQARENRDKLVLLEVMMERDDMPRLLTTITQALAESSRR